MGKRPGRERWGWPHSLQAPMLHSRMSVESTIQSLKTKLGCSGGGGSNERIVYFRHTENPAIRFRTVGIDMFRNEG